jgi:hypothetical protein
MVPAYVGTGLPDDLIQTKNPYLCNFWSVVDWKMSVYFMAVWNILRTFGILFGHLLHFVFIWYMFPVLVSCNKKTWQPFVGI